MTDLAQAIIIWTFDVPLLAFLVWRVWRDLRGDTFKQRMARAKWWQL